MLKYRFTTRLYFVGCAIIASFFGGMKVRRATLEQDISRARAEAEAAARDKQYNDTVLEAVQLQLKIALLRVRTAEQRLKPREADHSVPLWAGE